MKIYNTINLQPSTSLNPDERSWIYNGLDCCVTLEIQQRLRADLALEPDNVKETYATAMRKLAPVNYMCLKGLRIDAAARSRSVTEYKIELGRLNQNFDRIMNAAVDYTINWRSHVQVKRLFYETFELKKIRKRDSKGFFSPTANNDALERLCFYHYPQVFARYILAMRNLGKKISFLETAFDPDGRMRTSLNISGTDTGRFSSRFSAFGTGNNLQNVEERLRRVFVADPGYIFVNVDLAQADARNVGARIWESFYDSHGAEVAGKYLDTCESSDLHTRVCSMAWQELDWPDPWDDKKAKEVAEALAYRHYTYRFMAKKLGHGTNYYGQPPTMSLHTKIDELTIQNFQSRYFKAFPLIPKWHAWVFEQLKTTGQITTLFGRRRFFFDRYKDPRTLRKAIAYEPQSMTGEFLDRGWLQLWDSMPEVQLLLPVHDSILFQVPYEAVNELVPKALELLKVTLMLKAGRKYNIPLEAKTGFNWGDAKKNVKTGLWENENGLKDWSGKETRNAPKVKTRLAHYLS